MNADSYNLRRQFRNLSFPSLPEIGVIAKLATTYDVTTESYFALQLSRSSHEERKTISMGLRRVDQVRLILRQTTNGHFHFRINNQFKF